MSELIPASPARGRRRATLVSLAVFVLLGAAALAVGSATRRSPGDAATRTVTVVARGMAFHVAGASTANPTIPIRRGERIRLVLVHEDPGMTHDFAVPSLDAGTELLREAGATTAIVLQAPELAGDHDYFCTSHARMMRGILEVR
jgi:plastocyanin